MKPQDAVLPRAVLEQVYLIERDTGLLCRILGLYAARGIDVRRADYAYAASDVMTLKVAVATQGEDSAEAVRILVEKAASWFGVIAAAEQPAALPSLERQPLPASPGGRSTARSTRSPSISKAKASPAPAKAAPI